MKIRKKKIANVVLGGLALLLLLSGCTDNNSVDKEKEDEEEIVQYADEAFIKDMSKGLQERWKLTEKDEEKEGYEDSLVNSEEYKNMMISYIDAELDIIGKYTDEKFENSNLKELAIKYINLLNQHKEICQYITVDYAKYEEEFTPVYNERSKVISQMVADYKMTVSEEYQSTLDDFLAKSTLVKEEEAQKEEIEKMIEAVTFELTNDDGYGWRTYQGIIENTTGIDFSNMSFSINLLDSDGVIVETTYDQIATFGRGAKARLEFMTDKEFISTQITADWWE